MHQKVDVSKGERTYRASNRSAAKRHPAVRFQYRDPSSFIITFRVTRRQKSIRAPRNFAALRGSSVPKVVAIRLPRNKQAELGWRTARVQLEKKTFKVGNRRDSLSSKLFLAVLESIFRRLNWKELRINVDGTFLTHLRFADDIGFYAKTVEDINRMIENLAIERKRVGLKLNSEQNESDDK
ncbi:hypothetical protein EVAR_15814_1 [Eumeta japonica]|uniref:Reverse transcriptase domain-containing protein n=1 Tax=Eumeta variegata TaxID=151549 RepID=A0A4C1U081_EUMVA|nr:hypothetical protein EVAR_15814_1 [Eumeta japonica]